MKTKLLSSLPSLCALVILAAWMPWWGQKASSEVFAASTGSRNDLLALQTSTWHIQTVDTAETVGEWTSIALNTSGHPYISYYYQGYGSKVKCAWWTGTEWTIQTVDDAGWSPTSIALDSNGYPHISYYGSGGSGLKYARWTGSSWNIQTVASGYPNGRNSAIALDANGYPHISYYREGLDGGLRYARWTGTGWSIDAVDDYGWGWYTSITLDVNGKPHISYSHSNGGVRYARWTGSNWVIQSVTTGVDAYYSSIALDTNVYPHISYYVHSSGVLGYARWTGSNWAHEFVDAYVGGYTSIDLDMNDYPHISYYANSDLRYARWTGSSWAIETVDSFGNVGKYTSISLDADGYPHISYYHDTNTALKYAHLLSGGATPTATSSPATPTVTAMPVPMDKFVRLPLGLRNYLLPHPGTPTPTPPGHPTAIPTATPTATPIPAFTTTPTPGGLTPTPLPCGIGNCDFEQGVAIWTEYSQNGWPLIMHANDLPVAPHSGSWAAWLGGGYNEIAYLQQSVYIPTDRPYLSYWNWIESSDVCGYDFAYVRVNGSTVHQYDLCYTSNTDDWVLRLIDLGAYAGQTVQLQLRVETDDSLSSNLFLDDFAFHSPGN